MEKAVLADATLEYEASGTGEPVVFIHGALIAEAFRPLLHEPGLAGGYRLINYHRRGYKGSSDATGFVSVARQAADCRELLRHLGAERAHIVGHSFGGSVAVQLALDCPEMAHSLALLEPAWFGPRDGQSYRESLERGEKRFREEAKEVVVDDFLEMRYGAGYLTDLERVLPGAFEQAVAGAGAAFQTDAPALREWHLDEDKVRRIHQPVLNVVGADSEALWPRFGEVHRLVQGWLPHAESFVLPGAAHGLMLQNPRVMAEALADFWQRHPSVASVLSWKYVAECADDG